MISNLNSLNFLFSFIIDAESNSFLSDEIIYYYIYGPMTKIWQPKIWFLEFWAICGICLDQRL